MAWSNSNRADSPLYVHSSGEVSTNNSTSSVLLADAVYTGTTEDILNESVLIVTVFSNVASATDGLQVQWSTDGSNWDGSDDFTIPANTQKTFSFQPVARYFRVKYTNGGSDQTVFRLQTLLKASYVKPSSHRIQDSISTDDDAELTKSVITGENGVGVFKNVIVTADGNLSVANGDGPNIDAFGRQRVSQTYSLFDSKQTKDSAPLFFDDAETSGSGTGTSYLTNKSSTRISVSGTTAGTRVRQSKIWGTYQPGKSELVFITFANIESVSGIKKMAGYYNDKWGVYCKHEDGVANVGIRTYNTGSAVDNDIAQSLWNVDKMDGTGNSGVELDFSKTQIFVIDFEWLGVGRVRCGWVVDGYIYYCHYFNHTNNNAEVYMTEPSAPIRYEISNDGTGSADTFDTICASIMSEGGQEQTAISTYISRDGAPITLANEDLFTPVLSIRLKDGYESTRITPEDISILLTTSTNYEWALFLNPTIAGTDAVSWSNITNSSLQYDITRDNTNTLTGGYKISGGYGASTVQAKSPSGGLSSSFLTIGSKIDGTKDELVLGVKNIDGNGGTCYGGLNVKEYI
jgi:hypothetical protein